MKRLTVTVLLLAASALLAEPAAPAAAPSPAASGPAAAGVRNPFWPIGYEGKRETITAEVRVVPKRQEEILKEREAKLKAEEDAERRRLEEAEQKRLAAEAEAKRKAEEAEKAKIITADHWVQARAALRIGGRVKVRTEDGAEERSSVIINGNTYVDGDVVSFTHGRNRFTWRVTGLSDTKKLKLVRVRARNLDDEAAKKATADKDKSAKGGK